MLIFFCGMGRCVSFHNCNHGNSWLERTHQVCSFLNLFLLLHATDILLFYYPLLSYQFLACVHVSDLGVCWWGWSLWLWLRSPLHKIWQQYGPQDLLHCQKFTSLYPLHPSITCEYIWPKYGIIVTLVYF